MSEKRKDSLSETKERRPDKISECLRCNIFHSKINKVFHSVKKLVKIRRFNDHLHNGHLQSYVPRLEDDTEVHRRNVAF